MYIRVKVQAGAKKEEFVKVRNDHFKIKVKEKAERNMANKRVVEMVAEFFEIPKGGVRIINGHKNPTKLLSVNK